MEIYTFDSPFNTVMNVIYAIGAIALAVLSFFIIKFWIAQVIAYRKDNTKFPKTLMVFFSVLILVPLIGSIGLGNLFIKSVIYDTNMKNGDAEYFIGDPVVVSYEDHYYRGSFMGYKVELQIDGQTILPSNSFSKEILTRLQSDEELVIQYGEIKNDGLYIWSIKTIQE
jgi:hypothetical protein